MHTSGTIADGTELHVADQIVRLAASQCPQCDRWEFPARDYCPGCGSVPVSAALSSTGRVAGFTAVMHAPPGALIETPYVVALVEFPERVSVMSAMPGVAYEDVVIGEVVETVSFVVGEALEYVVRPAVGR